MEALTREKRGNSSPSPVMGLLSATVRWAWVDDAVLAAGINSRQTNTLFF